MSYQWGQDGPAFEYPNCFRTENRVLTVRAAVLLVLSVVVYWVALAEPDLPRSVAVLPTQIKRGDPLPHVLMATLLLLLAALDLWTVARQRRVLLVPGQPASLTSELVRQNRGTSAGAAWLGTVLVSGRVPTPDLPGPYRRPLLKVAPHTAAGPRGVWAYLALRMSHLLWGVGLLLALALTWVVARQPPTLALAALFYGGAAAALVARSAWISGAAPSPLALGVALVFSTAVGLLLSWFGGGLPAIGRLAQVNLPVAVLVLLLCLLLIEGLALLAGRVRVDVPPKGRYKAAPAQAELAADSDRVMQEVERELHRYWAEGIPNRRHAWQLSLADEAGGGDAAFSATVLEETQPLLPLDNRDGPPVAVGARRPWLLALQGLGLLLTLVGGALWVQLTLAHMENGASPWSTAAPALVLVVAGGYAARIGHLLWSRFEVDSTLLALEGRAETQGPPVHLSWTVARARSVFYAAADHAVGSRTLLELTADEAAGRRSVQQVRAYAERAPGADPRPAGPVVAPRPAAPAASAPQAAAAAAPRTPARFCPACGVPVLAGARFCQACGTALPRS